MDLNGCLNQVDDVWGIMWPNTMLNHFSVQPCPNHTNGHVVIGNCNVNIMIEVYFLIIILSLYIPSCDKFKFQEKPLVTVMLMEVGVSHPF